MADIVTIAGSPSYPSRSAAVLERVRLLAGSRGLTVDTLRVRDLNPEALVLARTNDPSIIASQQTLAAARGVVIATPVYKAAYSGTLKTWLDLLPQRALEDKIVFPIATGGSPAHLLAIDYALKPVLSALGAQHILAGLYLTDSQIQHTNGFDVVLDLPVEERLQATVNALVDRLSQPELVTTAIG